MSQPTASARNFVIVFDNVLSMDNYINSVCKSTYFHIRNFYEISKILDQDTASLLVHALKEYYYEIFPLHTDYCLKQILYL